MREHYKTDWHRYNLQRKLQSKPPISEEEFDELTEVSSIEGSDDDTDEEDSAVGTAGRLPEVSGSPFVLLPLADDQEKALMLYKQLFTGNKRDAEFLRDASALTERLRQLQGTKPVKWTLLMLAAGHFAGTVIDCRTGKAIVHKTFHRYTTRRKQGGAQSSNDSAKGKANSAGSSLRRYNEQALQQEIRELLLSWTDHIVSSDLIFMRVPSSSRKVLLFDGSPLRAQESSIRSFPFATRRPTLSELQRCFEELISVRQVDLEKAAPVVVGPATPIPVQARKPVLPVEPPVAAAPKLDPLIVKLIDLSKRSKVDLLRSLLDSNSTFDVNALFPESEGTSLLHVAAAAGSPEVVNFLLTRGANPTLTTEKKSLRPYEVAQDKDTRDAFRRYVHICPDAWDWKEARVPGALTPEMEAQQKEKDREKKKKQKEKQKAYKAAKEAAAPTPEPVAPSPPPSRKGAAFAKLSKTDREASGMTPEARARLDREKRALAAEARIRAQQNQCGACGKGLGGITPFIKFQFRYCSLMCVQVSVRH
ncbi:hypothetical protein DFS34DRAFT_641866 [Phlyctochytrium arcticum]|nr:hypothetical protein DFS34DRAFT_641866 [Phlyctochytrium arcticum]